jgi:simple sugar transport system substrate-binding protein
MDDIKKENIDEVKNLSSEKKVWKIIIPLGLVLVAVSILATYLFLSNGLTKNNSVISKICEGVNITFFPGGNATDSFASVVYSGAKQAEKDLGANVEYVWSDWDANKMVSQFIDAIAKGPDAIAIMGHPGSSALGALIDEAERKNIIVTAQNVDLPDIREKYSSKGFGYVGQDVYASGLMVASGLIRKYNVISGTEAIVFGVDPNTDVNRYQRTKGSVDGLKNGGLNVHEITMSLEVQKDLTSLATQKMISDALSKYPNTKVIITDHGALTTAMPSLLKNLGKNPGEIIVAGFDLSENTVIGIKNGYIGLVLDQQPYLQGYLPILQSCLTKKYGFAGLNIDTGTGLIDSSNVDLVSGLVEQKIR